MLYGWKENSMLTNCLAACADLTIAVSEIQRDIICEKIVILSYPLHSTPPLGGFPSEYRHPVWHGKTRMVSLPDGEKISKICLFVMTWSTNVTDGQTDRQTLHDSKDRAYASHRAVKIRLDSDNNRSVLHSLNWTGQISIIRQCVILKKQDVINGKEKWCW